MCLSVQNADETAVYFRIPRNYTVHAKGAKVKIKCIGYEKQRETLMLCIIADGYELSPHLILNRKATPKNEMFVKDITVHTQKWTDDSRADGRFYEKCLGKTPWNPM
jgi:hypothetical protein